MTSDEHSHPNVNRVDSDDILDRTTPPRNIQQIKFPEIQLLRGETEKFVTMQFTPKSLMTIVINNTGSSRMTNVLMLDQMDQTRYMSSSGGENHQHETRIQNTRSYGRWRILVEFPIPNSEDTITLEIPFFVVKRLDKSVREPPFVRIQLGTPDDSIRIMQTELIAEAKAASLLEEIQLEEQSTVTSTARPEGNEVKADKSTTEVVQPENGVKSTEITPEETITVSENVIGDLIVFDQFHEEVGHERLEQVKELFIPLDELEFFTADQLNDLNNHEIYYIEEFLAEEPDLLIDLLDNNVELILEVQKHIAAIISSDQDPIFTKYRKLGEINDNTLYYSTISVTDLVGIGEVTHSKLKDAGLGNITDLANAKIKNISKITGFTPKKVVEFIVEAKSLVYQRVSLIDYDFSELYPDQNGSSITTTTQLDVISTISLDQLNQLYGMGINNLEKLAKTDVMDLANKLSVRFPRVAAWVFEAQVLLNNRVSIQFRAIL